MAINENTKLLLNAFTKYLVVYIVLGILFFVSSGTILYTNGWIYLVTMSLSMGFGLVVLFIKDKQLLKKRLNIKEKEKQQIIFVWFSTILVIVIFTLPGLDFRFKWSSVPLGLVILADIILIIGYIIDLRVMLENSYASRVVEIQNNQKVIDTGMYSLVRHPMYFSMILIYIATPLILGSFVALIPSIVFVFSLVPRIINEEKVLLNGLEGYSEYMKKVRYRLIPYIW